MTTKKRKPAKKRKLNAQQEKEKRAKQFRLDRYAHWLTMTLEEKKVFYNVEDKKGNAKTLVTKGTDLEFAEIIGVNNETLSRYKDDENMWDIRDWYMRRLRANTPAVMRGLIRSCISRGGAQEVRAYMELVEGVRHDGRRHPGAKALEGAAEALENGEVESADAKINEDGSVDLTMRLKKYEFDEKAEEEEKPDGKKR